MIRTLEPMLASLTGPVVQVGSLSLDFPKSLEVRAVDELPEGDLGDVVLVGQIAQGRLGEADLSDLVGRMGESNKLCFVEPVCGVGLGRGLQKGIAGLMRSRWGWDFESDVPAIIRASGFRVISVDRFSAAPVEMVFTFAAGVAEPIPR